MPGFDEIYVSDFDCEISENDVYAVVLEVRTLQRLRGQVKELLFGVVMIVAGEVMQKMI